MKLSVCIDAVYNGEPVAKALHEIKEIGYSSFEFWSWWDKDLEVLQKVKEELEMTLVAFCTKFVSLVDPAQRDVYLKGLEESISVAKRLGCKQLITQVGNDTGMDRSFQHQSLVEGLKACVPLLEAGGITLLVEPLNTRADHKGYYLDSSDEAFAIIDEVGSKHVKVLFDIYHQQIMEGDMIRRITGNIDKIGHLHAAGTPRRSELYNGELNYNAIFKAIDEKGFNGYIGLEYFPLEKAIKGLRDIQLVQ